MCGRMTLTLDRQTVLDILGDVFHIENTPQLVEHPNYNIGPGTPVLSIISHHGQRRGGYLNWGFRPTWLSKESSSKIIINSRGEDIETKASFRESFYHRRCIILGDSFYEWDHQSGNKQPYRFLIKDQPLLPFAGIYTSTLLPDGSRSYSCSILTCEANSLVRKIHTRMPVIMDASSHSLWLSDSQDIFALKNLIKPYSSEQMESYPVSKEVNSIKNNSVYCILPLDQNLF